MRRKIPAMTLSDDELLDFDKSQMPIYDPAKAERALVEHGNAYRYQLVTARHIERWAGRLDKAGPLGVDPAWEQGFEKALRDIAAHLRQGDYLPGGVPYDQTFGK
jgi:hypothetical protein